MANGVARRLRNNSTPAERVLWRELRKLRPLGIQFRRQAPIDQFIVDFVCFSQRIVIEVDGSQHREAVGLASDAARDAHLRWQGFDVLRFYNGDVMGNVDGVMTVIIAELGLAEREAVSA